MQIVQQVRKATEHLFEGSDSATENLSTLERCHKTIGLVQNGGTPTPDSLDNLSEELTNLISRERQAMSALNFMDMLKQLDKNRPGDAYVLHMLTEVRLQQSTSQHVYHACIQHKPVKVNKALGDVASLQYDSFMLDTQTNHNPLLALAVYIFETEGLIETLHLEPSKFKLFMSRVQNGYKNVPYHNCIHAADVLQRVHAILKTLTADVFTLEEKLACYIAAIVHDYAHTGVSNSFLILTRHAVARRYNDRSPWEQHHVASALELIHDSSSNFMCNMTSEQAAGIRHDIIVLVRATDMSKHVKWMQRFSTCVPISRSLSHSHRLLALCLALKSADIGHTTSSKKVHLRWVTALQEEMYTQGDMERELGITVDPMRDRLSDVDISMSQVKFFDLIVLPLYQSLSECFVGTIPFLQAAKQNRGLNRRT